MDINELESFKLSDAVAFHKELNPKLWEDDRLDPKVRDQLLLIAEDFVEYLGISNLKVRDVTVSGSNAAYSYTPHSDLDLHVLVDFNDLPNNEVYQELFTAKKTLYNEAHDITVRDVPVELYVQDTSNPVQSLGEYSIVHDKWIRIPKKRRANFDQAATKAKYEKLGDLIELAIKSRDPKRVNDTIALIKRYRKSGLDKAGEFGPENLAYKAVRKQGLVQALHDLKAQLHTEKLSIDEYANEDYDPNGPPPGPEFKPTMPKGTVRVDVSDVYDWYKLGQHVSNLKGLGKHDFGKGPPSTILSFGDEDTEHKYIQDLEKTGLTTTDIDPVDPNQPKGMKRQKTDPTFNVNEVDELDEATDRDSAIRQIFKLKNTQGRSPSEIETAQKIIDNLLQKFNINPKEVGISLKPSMPSSTKIRSDLTPQERLKMKIAKAEYERQQAAGALKGEWEKFKRGLFAESEKQITELFNKPYTTTPKDDDNYSDDWHYEFTTSDGSKYVVSIFDPYGYPMIAFAKQENGKYVDTTTNTGDQYKIFATVGDVLKNFLTNEEPNQFAFAGIIDDPSRLKLYDKISQYLDKMLPDYRLIGKPSESMFTGGKKGRVYEFVRITYSKRNADYDYDEEDNLTEDFTSKQQVINYFVSRGKTAAQGASAWERGYRGPKPKQAKPYDPERYKNVRLPYIDEADAAADITFTQEPYEGWSGMGAMITAYSEGDEIGHVIFEPTDDDKNKWYATEVEVEDQFQRRGIATTMYDMAKKLAQKANAVIVPSHAQTSDAKGLWKDKNIWEASEFTFAQSRRKLNVPALIKAGAIFITEPHGPNGWEPDAEGFSLVTLYNLAHGGWTSEAKQHLKPSEYNRAAKLINAPVTNSNHLVYDGKYNQILWSIKKLGIPDNEAFMQDVTEASGYIPSAKEKNDPRFKTALTVDVKPDAIKKNAKAFGWKTSRAGIPPQARADGKIAEDLMRKYREFLGEQQEEMFPGYDEQHREKRLGNWLAKSWAVKDGKPQTFYHATTKDFDTFNMHGTGFASALGMAYEVERHGSFFAVDPKFAEDFIEDPNTGRVKEGGRVLPVHLSIQSPIDLRDDALSRMLSDEETVDEFKANDIDLRSIYNHMYELERWELFDGPEGAAFVENLQKLGFDGAIINESIPNNSNAKSGQVWVAFNPSQVKSIHNRGSFSPDDNRLMREDQKNTVPKIGYHVTATKNLPIIKQNGIKADKRGNSYVWDSREMAEWFKDFQNDEGQDRTILKIDMSGLDANPDPEAEDMSEWSSKFKPGTNGGAWIISGPIPPDKIKG